LSILDAWNPEETWPGLRLLMTSTTGEHAAWFVLDEHLQPQPEPMPPEVQQVVDRIGENCEPSLVSVLFLGGAGGSLRSGVTDNPIQLTRAVKKALVNVTCGGAPAYVWPGGGITLMVDVLRMPANSFGTVPTPAIADPHFRQQHPRPLAARLAAREPLPAPPALPAALRPRRQPLARHCQRPGAPHGRQGAAL
jgi:hypothetical protein